MTDTSWDNTLIIIPAYNEQDNISQVVFEIREQVPGMDIVVVNDGSKDQTEMRAKEAGASVLSHPFNLGYGVALQTGYKYAMEKGYKYVVQLDGDGQHDPRHIRDLLTEIKSGGVDLVIGSRFLAKVSYKVPFARRMGMRIFGTMASLLVGREVTDPTSGYQAMNRKVIDFFTKDIYPYDYPDADVILMLHRAGFRTEEIPVAMRGSSKGESIHKGLAPLYYIFKMCLSMFLTLLRKT